MSPPGRAGRRPPPDRKRPPKISAHDSTTIRGHYGPSALALALDDVDDQLPRLAWLTAVDGTARRALRDWVGIETFSDVLAAVPMPPPTGGGDGGYDDGSPVTRPAELDVLQQWEHNGGPKAKRRLAVVADGDEGVGRTAAWYKALRESDLSPTQTLVARTIADFAGPDGGRAFMSNATLGKACRLDTETVRRATRELRRKGWIISNREGPGDTRGRRYRLSIPSAAPVDNPSRPFASARSEPVDKRQTVRQTVRHSPPRPCASAHLDRALQTTELSSNEGSNEVVVATAPTTAPPVGDDPTTTTSSTTGTSQRQECPRHAGEPGGTFPDSGKPRCRPCRQSKPPDDARDGSPADPRSYPPDAKDLNDQFYGCKHPNCRCNHGRCVGGRMPFRRDGSGGDPCPDCEAAS